jgi:hypothetical protein
MQPRGAEHAHLATQFCAGCGNRAGRSLLVPRWCDLHLRVSRGGSSVVIDALHIDGRQRHLIDVSAMVG